VIDLLKTYFKIADRDTYREIREKVTGKILTLDRVLESVLSPLLALLDVPVDDGQWSLSNHWSAVSERWMHQAASASRSANTAPACRIRGSALDRSGDTNVSGQSRRKHPTTRYSCSSTIVRNTAMRGAGKTYYTQLRLDTLHRKARRVAGHPPRDGSFTPATEGSPSANGRRQSVYSFEEGVRTLVETNALRGERGAYELVQAVGTIEVPPTVQAILASRIDRFAARTKAASERRP